MVFVMRTTVDFVTAIELVGLGHLAALSWGTGVFIEALW